MVRSDDGRRDQEKLLRLTPLCARRDDRPATDPRTPRRDLAKTYGSYARSLGFKRVRFESTRLRVLCRGVHDAITYTASAEIDDRTERDAAIDAVDRLRRQLPERPPRYAVEING